MTIPQTVKIGALEYKVVVTPDIDNCGDFDSLTGTIRINGSMPPREQEATFFHEAMHAMNSEFSDGAMHALLASLSLQLYQFLKENQLLNEA